MAATTTGLRIAAVVVLVLVAAAVESAQTPAGAPAPSPSSDCFTALLNMSDCLTYVEDGSKLAKPDKGCCPELAGLVDSNPICLCQLLGNPDASPVKIDYNKALKLPSVCGVTTPPVSTCSAVGVPVSLPPSTHHLSPRHSPKASATSPPPAPDAAKTTASPASQPTSADEAATTPSSPANKNDNGALSIKASLQLLIFGFAITAFASIF